MSKPFPTDDPFLKDNYAPWPLEGDVHDLVVEGEIPRELAGSYFRNGPNPQFAPRGRYHWFDGDGMIHAFRIRDGLQAGVSSNGQVAWVAANVDATSLKKKGSKPTPYRALFVYLLEGERWQLVVAHFSFSY